MVNNYNHCCKKMAAETKTQAYPPTPFAYNPYFREYSIAIPDSHSVFCITFCPMCGTKLPTSLRDEWYDAMDLLKIDSNLPEGRLLIPKEFLTDEWWKKRGL